jgi:peroxiredoxin Q/BCP
MRGATSKLGGTLLAGMCIALTISGAIAQDGGKTLKVGAKAPAFTSVDDQGKPWKSADLVGKKILVLYFYPADLTGGCTKQACGYRDDLEKLTSKGVEIVGVSADSPENHRLFKKVHKLNFTLLADEKAEVAKAFGIPVKEGQATFNYKGEGGVTAALTRGATISRYTVVIDKAGNIAAIDAVKDAGGDPQRIANVVKNLESK